MNLTGDSAPTSVTSMRTNDVTLILNTHGYFTATHLGFSLQLTWEDANGMLCSPILYSNISDKKF